MTPMNVAWKTLKNIKDRVIFSSVRSLNREKIDDEARQIPRMHFSFCKYNRNNQKETKVTTETTSNFSVLETGQSTSREMLDIRGILQELDEKVIEHCHSSGRFIGYAHSDCNIQRV